jgi:hypothetical protein
MARPTDPFKRNPFLLAIIVVSWASLCLPLPVLVMINLIKEGHTGTPHAQHEPSVFVLAAIFISPILLSCLFLNLVLQFCTGFTDEGITQPSLRGRQFLAWEDVSYVQVQRSANARSDALILYLYDDQGKALSTVVDFYADPYALVQEVERRVPFRAHRDVSSIQSRPRKRR